ncbi:MAG: putative integral membrane protein (TIGR00698 family) [Paracoccaceae bacterium]|jgi:uncharacterized integral membrane protein (TIGR00698 family)
MVPPMVESSKTGTRQAGGAGVLRVSWWLAAAVALAARLLQPEMAEAANGSRFVPSTSVMALLFGMMAGALPGIRSRLGAGVKLVSKQAIPIAIVLLGFGLDLQPLLESGQLSISFVLVVVGMLTAFGASMLFGRLCGLGPRASMLLGAGTAVCGNSAIMAVAPTVDATDEDVGLAIGVINLLGVLMVLALPPVVGAFGITGTDGGALAGLTVHAVPQAIATGEAFGPDAISMATVLKLLRVVMLAPVVFILAFVLRRVRQGGDVQARRASLPWFVVLFVLAAGMRALGWVDAPLKVAAESRAVWGWLQIAGTFILSIALAAIGIGLDVKTLIRVGPRFLVAGTLAVTAMVAALVPLVHWFL